MKNVLKIRTALLISLTVATVALFSVHSQARTTQAQALPLEAAADGNPAFGGSLSRNAAAIPDGVKTAIYNAIINFRSTVSLSSYQLPMTDEVRAQLSDYVFSGSPRFFNVKQVKYAFSVTGSGRILTDISFVYVFEPQRFSAVMGEIDAAAAELLKGIRGNASLGDVEKALLIHDRLALRCTYDRDQVMTGTHAPESATPYGALVLRKAVCEGYARAYWYLLDQVGVECKMVRSQTLDHSWNIVYINGIPYHVDVTWDDPLPDLTGEVLHTSFLVSTDCLYENHHRASDYDTSPSDTTYDDWFWRNSESAFVLLGNEIYYLDNFCASMNRYSDRKTLPGAEVVPVCARLCTDGKDLYYNTINAVIRYSVSTGVAETVYAFPEGEFFVEGFAYEDGYFTGEILEFSGSYKSYRVQYSPKEDSESQTADPADGLKPGDVDGDGAITSADARLALRAAVQLSNEPADVKEGSVGYKAADYDRNGKVEASDARCILRVSVQLDPFG